jgi:ketosteroid isomerase-like protein
MASTREVRAIGTFRSFRSAVAGSVVSVTSAPPHRSSQRRGGRIRERRPTFALSVETWSAGRRPDKETDMAEHPSVAIVRNAYESFAKGDLDGALADLADNCVFHFGGDGPNSGDQKGREAITAALIKNFELTAGTQTLDVKGIYADEDHAAVVLHETASRPDGASIAMDEMHVLRRDQCRWRAGPGVEEDT